MPNDTLQPTADISPRLYITMMEARLAKLRAELTTCMERGDLARAGELAYGLIPESERYLGKARDLLARVPPVDGA